MQTMKPLRYLAVLTLLGAVTSHAQAQRRNQPEPAPRPPATIINSEMAIPTGDKATSVILIERRVPTEVRARAVFEYDLRLTNLTKRELRDVTLSEHFPPNFKAQALDPRPVSDESGVSTWRFTRLAPGATEWIKIRGSTDRPDTLSLCATVTIAQVACTDIKVVEPQLQLTKSLPREVLICDPIPLQFVVSNPGSGVVRNVHITDTLPPGLTTTDGKAAFIIDAGDFGPGQSREFNVGLQAARTGEYRNTAVAKADDESGLSDDGSAVVIVRRPILEVAMKAPEFRFAGRPANYEITVKNTGDAPARDTVLTDTLPAGTELVSADGGQQAEGRVNWSLGTLQPGAVKTVRLTLRGNTIGMTRNQAVAKAYCAEANAVAPVDIRGVPAILLEMRDDPDPIDIGGTTTYTIDVTNQGTIADTNIVVTAIIPPEEDYVSSEGATRASMQEKTIRFAPLPSLAPKAKATWKIVVKGTREADVRFKVMLSSNATGEVPVEKTESTHIY